MPLGTTIPALPARDVPASTAFYVDRLGFTVAHTDGHFSVLERDDARIHLWEAADTSWRARTDLAAKPVVSGAESFLAGTASCRIEVTGIDELYAEMAAAGVAARGERSGSGGHRLRHPRVPRARPRRQPADVLPLAVDGRPVDPGRHHPVAARCRRPSRRTGRGRAPRGRRPRPAASTPPRLGVAVVDPRRAGGVRRERRLERDRLLGQEASWPAGPSSPYAVRLTATWIASSGFGRADRPVAAGDQPGAGALEVAERVLPGRPLLAEERQRQLDHLVVEAGPQHLQVGRDPELGEAAYVVGVHQLEVRDVVATLGVGAARTRRAPRGRRGRRWRGRAPGSRRRRAAGRTPAAPSGRRTSGRCCRSRGRSGRGRARRARR